MFVLSKTYSLVQNKNDELKKKLSLYALKTRL